MFINIVISVPLLDDRALISELSSSSIVTADFANVCVRKKRILNWYSRSPVQLQHIHRLCMNELQSDVPVKIFHILKWVISRSYWYRPLIGIIAFAWSHPSNTKSKRHKEVKFAFGISKISIFLENLLHFIAKENVANKPFECAIIFCEEQIGLLCDSKDHKPSLNSRLSIKIFGLFGSFY